jgi:hypothetical protein
MREKLLDLCDRLASLERPSTPAAQTRMTRAEMQREIERLRLCGFRDMHGREPAGEAELTAWQRQDDAEAAEWCQANPDDPAAREWLRLAALMRDAEAAEVPATSAGRTATDTDDGWPQ